VFTEPSNPSSDGARSLRAAPPNARAGQEDRAATTDQQVREQLIRETRLAALERLSVFVAHDLRNPLGVIRLATSLLRRRLSKIEFDLECLNEIEAEIQTADEILTGLLDATRGRAPELREVELGPLLDEAARRTDASGRVQWAVQLGPEPVTVWCDPDQIRQVFRNVLRNAVEAMKGRGTVMISGRPDGAKFVIDVRDSGPGVSADIRADMFEPLVTSKRVGAGLGLTVSRRIVEQHGGTIELITDDQPGAAFRIILPTLAAQ
jgi:signal transduction histidine kinase